MTVFSAMWIGSYRLLIILRMALLSSVKLPLRHSFGKQTVHVTGVFTLVLLL